MKIFHRLLIAFAIVAIAGWLGIFCAARIWKHHSRAAWNDYVARAKARGDKIELAAFIPPPIPEQENAAAIPLFARAFTHSAAANEKPFAMQQPAPKIPKLGEAIDWAAWRKYVVEQKWIEATDSSEPAAAVVLRGLDAKFGNDWRQLQDALQRPRARFPIEWEKGIAAPFPHLSILLNASKLGALRALAHLSEGNSAAAQDDVFSLVRLANLLRVEPSLIAFLVRMNIFRFAFVPIRAGLDSHLWHAEDLSALDAMLADASILKGYRFALQSERGLSDAIYEKLEEPKNFKEHIRAATGDTNQPLSFANCYPRVWLFDNRLRSARFVDGMLACVDFERGVFQPDNSHFDPAEKAANRFDQFHYLIFYLSAPVYPGIEARTLEVESEVRCAREALALEKMWLQRGDYPNALREIPADAIQKDVINGAALRYRRNGAGYVLYSVALNSRDDGGVQQSPASAKAALDWVW